MIDVINTEVKGSESQFVERNNVST